MDDNLTVAAVQSELREVDGFPDFARQMRGLLERTDGADLVVLPELCTASLFTARSGWRGDPIARLARIADYTDDYCALFAELARTRGQVIAAGSHLVRDGDAAAEGSGADDVGGVRNTAFVFFPDGSLVRHVKTHIFPAEAQWGTVEGDRLAPFRTGEFGVGVSVCYETEIPEVVTVLARQGADLVISPSYTFTEAGFWRVRHCAQARAIENQVYVVHCPTVGDPGAPLSPGWGRASVLSPCDTGFPADGVLAEAATNSEDVVTATLDLSALRENRRTGAATTRADRSRRAQMYRGYARELLPEA
jgi:predicted amidohydrolase